MREIFLHWIYPFHAISSNFGFFVAEKPPPQGWGKFFTLDLSISCNFQQLWFFVAEKPPPPVAWMREIFYTESIHFMQFPATLVFCGRKAPPSPQTWGKIFLHWIYPFHAISSNFGFFVAEKPPPQQWGNGYIHFMQFPATLMAENPLVAMAMFQDWIYPFHCNFQQLWFFVAEKPPPQDEREIFLHWIYPFHAISSNFGFLWQKSPPPQ